MKKVQLCVLMLLMAGWLSAQNPTVTNVTSSSPDGSYGVGDVIPVQVTFSSPVTVNTGTPTITLETGTTDQVISYVSGSGTNTLTFNYTVQIGDLAADLDYVANSLIANPLHKGSIQDGAGTAELTGPETVAVSGNYAYVASNGGNVLEIVNISNPSAPSHAGKLTITGAWGVSVLGNYAYVTSISDNSLTVVNVSNPTNPTQVGSLTDNVSLISPIGVFVSGNYAYVASVDSDNLAIIDISNPANPVNAGSITDGTGGATLGGARAVFVSGNYAYVASQNDDALEIVNISNPATPVHVGSLVDNSRLNGAYGVFVSGNYAYVASNLGNGLEIINISNPATPTHAGFVTITAAQSVYVNGNTAYVASNDPADAMVIVDVTNPNAPFIKNTVVNGQNGALLDNASSLTYANGYVYVASWSSNALEIIDVSPIRDAGNEGANLTLPTPGAAGSLGFNKDITIGSLPFITTWVTTSGNITIPTTGGGYNYSVTWTNLTNPGVGEGSVSGQTGNYIITGLQNGSTYQVEISGNFPRFYMNDNVTERTKIRTIEQWGDIAWTSMEAAFFGCSNLTYNASDAPDLSIVESLHQMFASASSFNGNLNNWNTSNIKDMSSMFNGASSFNNDLNNWNTGSVTNMSYMFFLANAFNGNISTWNTSSVIDMTGMFRYASAFNGNISSWNTSNVIQMTAMFSYAPAFNGNLSSWNTGSVTDMNGMFTGALSFNSDISNWNTVNVQDMAYMFQNAQAFNSELNNWNTGNVLKMMNMFYYATSFDRDLSNWNTSKVNDMSSMFMGASLFNQNISAWNTSLVNAMYSMFEDATSFNQDLSSWDISGVQDMSYMLNRSGLSGLNYDATLQGWATLGAGETQIPSAITLGADGLTYCAGATARQSLIDSYGWTITGDTQKCGPTVTGVSSSATDGAYGVGAVIPVTVTFNVAVTVTGTPTLTLETGTTDRVVNYTSGTGTTTLTFNYTVQAGDVSADLDYLNTTALALNGGTIKDAVNLDAILTLAAPAAPGSLGANKAIVIDGVVPLAPSTPDLATADDIGASNTDNITSIDAGLTLTGTAEDGALITFTEAGLGVLGSITATGGNYSFDFDIGSGTYNISATAQDVAGNISVASGSLSITIDTGNPTVTINQGSSQPDPAVSVPVTFDIVFNKAIDPASFINSDIILSGTAAGLSVTSLTTIDNITWTLGITASGNGTIIPNINANAVFDIAGNSNVASTSTDNSVDYTSCVNPVLALSSTANTFCVGGNGSATVDTIDGITNPAGFTYQWYTGTDTSSPIPSATNSTVNNLIGGDYTVEVIHTISGCSSTATITVPDLGGPYTLLTTYTVNQPTCTVTTASVDFTDLPTSSWTITASPLGTTLNGATATATFSGLPAGATYTFFLRDNVTGCTIAETSPEVIDPAPVSPALTPSTTPNTACDVNYNGGINITAVTSSGEPSGYSYLIVSGPIGTYPTSGTLTGSTLTLSDLPPGNYSIDITNNDNTCSSNAALSVLDNIILPDIALGTSPSVIQGTTVASLPYTSTTGTPDQYAIDFDATAEAQGFVDVAYTTLPVSPISITVPAAAIAATYNATLTVKNSTNACVSVNKLFIVQVTGAAPVITAVTIPNVSMKIGDIVTTTITVNSSTEEFTLPGGSTIGGFALGGLVKVNNTTYTATFTIVSGGTDVAAGSDIPVNVILNGTGGNSAAFITAIAQASDPIDANAPLFSATAPATNATISNTQVSYTLSENLASGSITWTRTGGTADVGSPHVQTLSGSELTSGTKTNITLSNNPSLVIGAVYSISFSGTDGAGNTATTVTNTNITFNIDATPPTVVSINYQTPATSPTNTNSLTFRVTFTETVTGVAAADFSPITSGVTIGALSVTAVNGTTYDVTIATVAGSGTVRLDVLNTATITDAANNPYVANFTTGQVYIIDQTAPVFSATAPLSNSTVTNANVSYTLSEALASGTITWTQTGGTTDAGSPHVITLSGSELAAGAKTNITLTNNPTLINGAVYSIAFGGTDAAGNTASIVTNTNITFNNDATPPVVTSINYQTPATSPTNATAVTFRITFNEPVLNVDAADFTKTLTGVAGGAITVIAINGTTYDATFAVAGSGTVRLDVLSNASITDALGNVYASNFTSGAVYTIDQTPPLFSATGPASNSTATNTQVSYTLSENLSSGTITWTRTGGTADAGSPHVQSLTGVELTVGPHANITLTNNPALVAGAAYTIAFNGTDLVGNSSLTVTETNVTYTPPPGNLSDIVVSNNFSYPENINYASFQEANDIQNSTTSINVARFDIRDGGAAGDADPFPTIVTGITLDLGSNFSVIRRIALYNGSDNSELAGTDKSVSSRSISFSNLAMKSDDNVSSSFIVRVSFAETVTDNVQFSFTVTAATAQTGNSGFGSSNAGGAVSSTAGNNNRIEVVASRLNFVQQPSNAFVNAVMSPAVTIESIDENGNRDLDFTGNVGFTTTGSLSSTPNASCTSGFGTSDDMIFSAAGTGLTLTTSNSAGLTNVTSTSFDIYDDPETIALVIKSVLTPNTADNQNNVLHIENIEFFPENMVKLIDRWGVPIKSWTNFSNYTTPEAEQPDFNFTNLDIGNYICVVEYLNPVNGNKKSQTQMITVLK
jgi:surface protein